MTGVSLRHRGGEHLALPGGLDALRAGHTGGLPLLAPWANRLSQWGYRAAGVSVDLAGLPLGVDDNGLPIHGLARRASRDGSVDRLTTRGDTARVRRVDQGRRARLPVPAPHRGRRRSRARRSSGSTPRSSRPAVGRCRSRSGGIRTSASPAPDRSQWRLRLPTAPSTSRSTSGGSRPATATPESRRGGSDRAPHLRRRLRPRP